MEQKLLAYLFTHFEKNIGTKMQEIFELKAYKVISFYL